MATSNPGMFFSSGTLKGLMSTSKKKKTSRKPAQTEAYQTEVEQLIQTILKQETGRDNIPKNQWRKKTSTRHPSNTKSKTKTIVVRKMRSEGPRQFHNFSWNNIFNYASAVGLDRVHVEYLEHNFGQFVRSTRVASESLAQGYELASEKQDGILTAEEAAAALSFADVDVDEYAFSTALRKGLVSPDEEASSVKDSERDATEGVISFDRWAHSLVHDVGCHQMASALAERYGLLNNQSTRGLNQESTASFLPGSLFDTTSIAMEHSSRQGPPLYHSQTVQALHQSEFEPEDDSNVRRSQSQGKAAGQSLESKRDMMLTLPPLPSNGSKYSSTMSTQAIARKRRKKGDCMESTLSNKKLQSVGGFDQSFGRQTPRCLREGSTRTTVSVERAGSMSAIDELRRELRLAEEGVSRLDNIVEDNIAWVQTHCEVGPNFDMSVRAKARCRKIAIEKFVDVLGNSAFSKLDKAFRRWRMLFQFTDMMTIVRSYSKIKSVQLFGNAFGKIIFRIQSKVIARWSRACNMMRRFEQEAALVEIQRIVRGRLGKNRSKRRVAELEQIKMTEACARIQKIARGKQGRKKFTQKWKEHRHDWAVDYLQHWFKTRLAIQRAKDAVEAKRQQRRAATKVQKIARGKQGRQRAADVKRLRAEQKRAEASSSVLSRFLRRNKETKSERNLLKQKREEKKKNMFQQGISAVSNALSSLSGKSVNPNDNDNDIDRHNFGEDIDKAAVKLQSVARGRVARQKSMRLKQNTKATDNVPPAVQEEQKETGEDIAELDAAALKLQAVSRGRLARKDSERRRAEQKKGGMSFFSRKRDGEEANQQVDNNSVGSEKSSGFSDKLFSGKLFGRGSSKSPANVEPVEDSSAVVPSVPISEEVAPAKKVSPRQQNDTDPTAMVAGASAVKADTGAAKFTMASPSVAAEEENREKRKPSTKSARVTSNVPGDSIEAEKKESSVKKLPPKVSKPTNNEDENVGEAAVPPDVGASAAVGQKQSQNSKETPPRSSSKNMSATTDAASPSTKLDTATAVSKQSQKSTQPLSSPSPRTTKVQPNSASRKRSSSKPTAPAKQTVSSSDVPPSQKSKEAVTGPSPRTADKPNSADKSATKSGKSGRTGSVSPDPEKAARKPYVKPASKNNSTRSDKQSPSPVSGRRDSKQSSRPTSRDRHASPGADKPTSAVTGSGNAAPSGAGRPPSGSKKPPSEKRPASGNKKPSSAEKRPPSGSKKTPLKSPQSEPNKAITAPTNLSSPKAPPVESVVDLAPVDKEQAVEVMPTVIEHPEPRPADVTPPVEKIESSALVPPVSEVAEPAPPIQIAAAEIPSHQNVTDSKRSTEDNEKVGTKISSASTDSEKPVTPEKPTESEATPQELEKSVPPVVSLEQAPERKDKPTNEGKEQVQPEPDIQSSVPVDSKVETEKEEIPRPEPPKLDVAIPDPNVQTAPDRRPKTPSNLMRSAKTTLNNIGSSFRRAVSPLVGSRPSSKTNTRQNSKANNLTQNDDSPVSRAQSRESVGSSVTMGSISKQGSRSALLSQDERMAVEETKRIIDAQRKAAEYLTWAAVTIQRLARQYLAKRTAKKMQRLKKKRPQQWIQPGPDSKYYAKPKDLSRKGTKKKRGKKTEKPKRRKQDDDEDDDDEMGNANLAREEADKKAADVAKAVAEELQKKMDADAKAMEERIQRLEALENSIMERELKVSEISKQAELQAEQAREALQHIQAQQRESEEEKIKMKQLLEMAAGPLSHRTDVMATGGMATGAMSTSGGERRRSASSTPRRRGSKSGQMSARDRGLPPTALSARGGAGVPDDANVVQYEGDDWVQLWDPDEYSWYWYNRRTQAAQWEYPGTDADGYSGYESAGGMTDYSTDAGEESGYESEYGHQNASPWQEFWDEQAQAKYWYNEATGEASWTKPEDVGGGSKPGSARGAGRLGDDWVSYIDDETDQEYWYNAITGETSWAPAN